MAPVLLDHRSMKRIILTMALSLVTVFLSGYLVGFQKAELRLTAPPVALNLALPEPEIIGPVQIEPQIPMLALPGESVDVDRADDASTLVMQQTVTPVPTVSPEPAKPVQLAQANADTRPGAAIPKDAAIPKQTEGAQEAENLKQTLTEPAKEPERPASLAIGGPVVVESGLDVMQDNASEESAEYTIQVGMYGLQENAERRVEELQVAELSAYLTDYQNKNNETRYNVRFGYYADKRSANAALAMYQKEMNGSGYIVRFRKAENR